MAAAPLLVSVLVVMATLLKSSEGMQVTCAGVSEEVCKSSCHFEAVAAICCKCLKQCCPSGAKAALTQLAPCYYNNEHYYHGTKWQIDLCTYGTCDDGVVHKTPIDCPPLPPGCTVTQPPDQCCPICQPPGDGCTEGTVTVEDCNTCVCFNGEKICSNEICTTTAPTPQCVEGEVTQVDCNTCICTNGVLACTKKACICTDGHTKQVDCNTCVCRHGQYVCTLIACDGLECIENQVTTEDCNTCICVDGQKICTQRACDPSGCVFNGVYYEHGAEWKPDPCTYATCDNGTVHQAIIDCPRPPTGCQLIYPPGECCPICDPEPECVEGEVTQVDCNTCICSNGVLACTERACSCVDGDQIQVDCNTCICFGGQYQCTQRICDGECVDGQVIQQDCNTCICVNGLLACTLKACIPDDPPGSCVDPNGVVRLNNTIWHASDPCVAYQCLNGHIRHITYTCADPPAGCHSPMSVPGQCCPTYNCTIPPTVTPPDDQKPCLDHYGRVHNSGDVWNGIGNPCVQYTCVDGLIYQSNEACVTIATPTTSRPTVPTGPTGTPTFCVDSNGNLRQHGENWQYPSDPCTYYYCRYGRIQTAPVSCPSPPNPDCVPNFVPGHCCPTYDCTTPATTANPITTVTPPGDDGSCIDNDGVRRPSGSVWYSAPGSGFCLRYRCQDGRITVQIVNAGCPPLPPGCNYLLGATAGCCRAYHCPPANPGDCVDPTGVTRPDGSSWTVPGEPCARYSCNNGVINGVDIPCPRPPYPGCTGVVPPGQCCPDYSGCVTTSQPATCNYNGQTYQDGEEFPDDPLHPCGRKVCDGGLVVSLGPTTACPPLACPNSVWPIGQCCRQCVQTSTTPPPPLDFSELLQLIRQLAFRLQLSASQLQQLELQLLQLQSALQALYTGQPGGTVVIVLQQFIRIIQIIGFPVPGDINSTNLTELTRILRAQLDAMLNALRQYLTEDQVNNAIIDFTEFVQWLLTYDPFNPINTTNIIILDFVRLIRNLLAVQGCSDNNGNVYPVNTIYLDNFSNPQNCFICTNGSGTPTPLFVLDVATGCGISNPLPPGCVQQFLPNACCPDINCPAGTCTDEHGTIHAHGTTFVDDPNHPCITYLCSSGVISVIESIECPPIPAGCSPWVMDGVCCPKADCPEDSCIHNGVERDHGTSWPENPLKPCVILTCLDGEISRQDNTFLCPPPPLDPDCVPRDVPNQCCPAYDCVRVNCTYNGQVYQEGQVWVDNPLYPCKNFTCTKEGTKKLSDLSTSCPPQPRPDCEGLRIQGQCCKRWQCPHCTHNGVIYEEGQVWWDNPRRQCIQYTCRAGIVVQLQNKLPCPTVPSNCSPNYAGVECCHIKYTCPFCMFDPFGNFIQMVQGP